MRKIALILAVLVAAAIPAHADGGPQELIDGYYQSNVNSGRGQHVYCKQPRNNDAAQCNQDFLALYSKVAQTLGWQLLYRRAKASGDEWSVQFYGGKFDESRKQMFEASERVEKLYYPLPRVTKSPQETTGQKTLQPKVYKSKNF